MTVFLLPLDLWILFFGIALTFGYGSSFLLDKYGVPNVVIYLLTGFFVANVFVSEIFGTEEFEFLFRLFETIALGMIGFKIGIDMQFKLLKENSRAITIFVLFEVVGAFALVFILTYLFTNSFLLSIVLAGLATATAPAATIEVIRRLNSKGPLTRTLKWILAFDDVIAVIVVEGILSYLIITTLGESLTIGAYFIELGKEIGQAIILGLVFGLFLDIIIEKLEKRSEIMEMTISVLILTMGLAHYIETSVILACMTIGIVTVNRAGNNYEKAEDYLDILMSPILIIFFLLVGAHIHWSDFMDPFPLLSFIYLIARSVGKIGGIFLTGDFATKDPIIKKNVGFGLLPQGGVALGLMAVANEILTEAGMGDIGNTIVVTIVISTVFSEGLGAIGARFALGRAGEIGKGDQLLD